MELLSTINQDGILQKKNGVSHFQRGVICIWLLLPSPRYLDKGGFLHSTELLCWPKRLCCTQNIERLKGMLPRDQCSLIGHSG